MIAKFCAKYVNWVTLAILLLGNVYGGIFYFLSGIFVAFFLFGLAIINVAIFFVVWAINTNKITEIHKKDTADNIDDNKPLNYAISALTYALIFHLGWYTVGTIGLFLHASFIVVWLLNKKKILAIYH